MSFKFFEEKLRDLKAEQEKQIAVLEKARDEALIAYKDKLNRDISRFFGEGDIHLQYDKDGCITGYDGFCLIRTDNEENPVWGKAQDDNFATFLYDNGRLVDPYNFVGYLKGQKEWPLEIAYKETVWRQEKEWRLNSYQFRSAHEVMCYHLSRGACSVEMDLTDPDGKNFTADVMNRVLYIDEIFFYRKDVKTGLYEEWDD